MGYVRVQHIPSFPVARAVARAACMTMMPPVECWSLTLELAHAGHMSGNPLWADETIEAPLCAGAYKKMESLHSENSKTASLIALVCTALFFHRQMVLWESVPHLLFQRDMIRNRHCNERSAERSSFATRRLSKTRTPGCCLPGMVW